MHFSKFLDLSWTWRVALAIVLGNKFEFTFSIGPKTIAQRCTNCGRTAACVLQ